MFATRIDVATPGHNPHPEIPGYVPSAITVTAFDADRRVDRHDHVASWGLKAGHEKLAARLARAIEAGVVLTSPEIRTDVNGKTYWSTDRQVLGRRLNADLKRLGY